MKKDKKVTYALLIVVASLWGVVLYKLYVGFFPPEPERVLQKENSFKGKVKQDDDQKIVLKANYRDPFLGKTVIQHLIQNTSNNHVQTKAKPKIKPKIEPVKVDWSFLQYMGLIKNQKLNKHVALVSIHGREYMVSEGEKVNDVSFIKNYKDSIKVTYQGITSHIRKQ